MDWLKDFRFWKWCGQNPLPWSRKCEIVLQVEIGMLLPCCFHVAPFALKLVNTFCPLGRPDDSLISVFPLMYGIVQAKGSWANLALQLSWFSRHMEFLFLFSLDFSMLPFLEELSYLPGINRYHPFRTDSIHKSSNKSMEYSRRRKHPEYKPFLKKITNVFPLIIPHLNSVCAEWGGWKIINWSHQLVLDYLGNYKLVNGRQLSFWQLRSTMDLSVTYSWPKFFLTTRCDGNRYCWYFQTIRQSMDYGSSE